ncbi:hypothetical protein AB0F77_34815 [Streptomyces sp. NPDC026672]|uniref:hypothetical protein n=1 Tax=unclassified Streptomyces TaxID=2593676 RepID=UPI0034092E77
MADEIEPTAEESVAQTEETPEVEAHSADEVLGLQGIDEASSTGVVDPGAGAGSCSSCIGSTCM